MNTRMKVLIAKAAIGVTAVAGAGIAQANSGGDDGAGDQPITGVALEQASVAALDHTGGGTVTETEVGDEESRYEVEVTMADGRKIDVQLDRDFRYVSEKVDHESGDGHD